MRSTDLTSAGAVHRVRREARIMASPVVVELQGTQPVDELGRVADAALEVLRAVERACTRFDNASPLMRLNAQPQRSQPVPRLCFDAVAEAYVAYRWSGGRFDPRVFGDLVRLGYDRSMDLGVPRGLESTPPRPALPVWHPELDPVRLAVRLGELPIDLGGIGKGLAIRWAAASVTERVDGFLIDAGGDCYCSGQAPDGNPWRIAVEDPADGPDPVAVLALSDRAVATSSVRLHRWRAGGSTVHHLIDPTTGLPGGAGLLAVTVVGHDPAQAEVATKVLFLSGRDDVAQTADRLGLAAVWVDALGAVGTSAAAEPFLLWRR